MFDVYLHDTLIGTLEPRGRGVRFTYSGEALGTDGIYALSLSLPKQEEPFPDSKAGPFFRNLLPEGSYGRLIAAGARTAPQNALALLGVIGGECPGAVSIWPAGTQPPATPQYLSLCERDISRLFGLEDRSALAHAVTHGRVSLAGVQEKIALLRNKNDGWRLPLNGAVTSHILKQATPAFPNLMENELFCMTLASAAGLWVPATDAANRSVRLFCTERFDRVPATDGEDQSFKKLHQEDFCQILSVEPERKYEFDGGPGLKACASVIRRHSSLPAEDLERLVRWVGFNYMIGNEDAHAKNLAFLYLANGLRLTPHYDLVSTEVYPNLERRLSMKIGGANDIRNVQKNDWDRFANALKLSKGQIREWLLELAEAVSVSLTDVAAKCDEAAGETPIYQGIMDICKLRIKQLAWELGGRR